jgi:hypothetical protein
MSPEQPLPLPTSVSPSGPVDNDPPNNKSLIDYWQAKSTSYSSRILQRVIGGPLGGFLLNKKPSNRDMLMIAATVVGSCDEKIAELEREREFSNRVSSFVNKQMFSAAPGPITGESEKGDDAPPQEANILLRYLTLRNFLSVAFVIITSLGGFIAFTTSNFKERAEARAQEVKELKEERDDLRNKLNTEKENGKKVAVALADRNRQADDLGHQVNELTNAKRALDDKFSKAQKEVETLKVKLAGLGETPPK